MAGKHHKSSRVRSSVAKRGGRGLATAAVSATCLSTAFVTGTTPAVAPAVELMALVTPANSTSQFFAGTTYYGKNYEDQYGPQQVVPFFLGPQGIADAIKAANDSDDHSVVLASGWGAGQTGTALGQLSDDDEDLENVDLVILDNNTNRAAGGFWTTYDVFAPLLLTSAAPTPSNLDVHILDVGYAHNINGTAPTDPANPFALGNSLAAYVYGYGGEQNAKVPQAAIDEAKGTTTAVHNHYVVHPNGTYTATPLPSGTTTTYVTFESEHLALLRPLRLFPGGDIVADALEPTMTELVDAGYEGGTSVPTDPTKPQPMRLFSSFENLDDVSDSIQQGLNDGAETAQEDFANPGNFVTKPLAEFGKLPVISSLPTSLTNSTVNITTSKKVLPGLNKPTGITSSTGGARPRPLKKIADDLKTSLNKLAGGAHDQNTEDPEND